MTEGYRDGEFEYGVIESLIEEIVDKYNLKAYVYIESDHYDNAVSTTMASDEIFDAEHDDIQLNALIYLVADILNNRPMDERNEAIAEIYDAVYNGIHIDDDDEDEDNLVQ